MPIISVRLNKQEEKLIKEYAKLNNIGVSELLRSSVLEKIEGDIDLKGYNQAIAEHRDSPNDISFDEMMQELYLNL